MSLKSENQSLVDTREQTYLDKKIRRAYLNHDAVASKLYHNEKMKQHTQKTQLIQSINISDNTYPSSNWEMSKDHLIKEKEHKKGKIEYIIKTSAFSALDGIITLFSIVASISASDLLDTQMIVILGLSKVIADSISMGIGMTIS